MLQRIFPVLFALTLTAAGAHAQRKMDLAACISYARQNSISIKQAQNAVRTAELSEEQNTYARLPNLTANINGGYQFGRTIDPTSNRFENTEIGFNSIGISTGALLYNGNRINNSIQQSRIDLQAAQLDAEFTADNLSLNIALAYLNILLAEDQLELVNAQLDQTRQQLQQTDRLIQAGSLPENARLDILSQLAANEQTVVEAENLVAINYLTLKQFMEIDPQEEFVIVRPELDFALDTDPDIFRLEALYNQALGTQANIRAGDLRIKSAELGVDIARSATLPSLFISGSINSTASTAARRIGFYQSQTVSQDLIINGTPVTLEQEIDVPVLEKYPYSDQINDNFGQSISAGISIPIYNRNQNTVNIERARLAVIQQELANRQDRQTLKTNVQRAIADARAARRSLDAAQRSVEAASVAFENAKKRFDLGAINSLEFSTARNTLDQAEISLIRAKYTFLFRTKQLEFYQGKGISL